MDYFIQNQFTFMVMLGGICGFIFFFLLFMKIEDRQKKKSFLQIAFFIMVMLFSDRLAYLYRGNESTLGFWMVRISNFLVFFSILMSENGFNNYLLSVSAKKQVTKEDTRILYICRAIALVGAVLLVISQFTGLYYTFDATNHYVRSRMFILCYAMPVCMLLMQMVFVTKHHGIFSTRILWGIYLFLVLPLLAGVVQIFCYGASLTSISMGISAIFLYFLALRDQNYSLNVAARKELMRVHEMEKQSQKLLYQTVEALASAVDTKDAYTHGHSNRVAKYAKRIAELSGMSEAECEEVYLAGLLHDVGKIGIQDSIINKEGRLTNEEYAIIKQHPALGERILTKISLMPTLSVGARYHHERYDGSGYPDRLKGDDIPTIGRIIAVADAYDAMTSKRSYRDQIPQQQVREELVNGIGTQFDPEYAKIMIDMLDHDRDYQMKERRDDEVLTGGLFFNFTEFKSAVSAGLQILDRPVTINLRYKALDDSDGLPTLLFYDSADARYYKYDSATSREMDFLEYGSVCLNGKVTSDYVRKVQQKTTSLELTKSNPETHSAEIVLLKQDDHLMVRVIVDRREEEVIYALHDASHYLYVAVTGASCSVDILSVSIAEEPAQENRIPRIAEKISYILAPQGDIPNLQVDGWRAAHSEGIELCRAAEVRFHTLSLPSSRRIWHCPIVCMYTSADGTIGGEGYKELALIRFDGEVWSEYSDVINTPTISRNERFENWDAWKQRNKDGLYCTMSLLRDENKILTRAEDGGVTTIIHSIIPKEIEKVYFFFTGDQCALTDIRINSL